jgi:two-component system cell cycle sensor histidine kinase PleC
MVDSDGCSLPVDAHRNRILREQLAYTVLSLSRGSYGVVVLAIVLGASFASIDGLGDVPAYNAILFCSLVATWSVASLLLVRAYYRRDVGDRALEAWRIRFLTLIAANGVCWGAASFLLWVPGHDINNFALVMLCVFSIANAAIEHGGSRTYFLGLSVPILLVNVASLALHPSDLTLGCAMLLLASTSWFTLMALHAHRRFTELVLTKVQKEELALANCQARDEAVALKIKAETASSAKSTFLANMSHELRTPLNAIIGFAQIVRDEMFGPVGSPRYREYVSDIERSGQHLLGIINDLLDVAKIEAGRMEIRRDVENPADFINDAILVARGQTGAASARITTEFAHDDAFVFADTRMMRQTVINLLSNAIKHNLPGEPISIATSVTPENMMRIVIRDRGAGIPAHMLDRVFEVFEQADNSYARERQGTGLGLALVRAFIAAHDGRVWLESEQGTGTAAIIELPIAQKLAIGLAA